MTTKKAIPRSSSLIRLLRSPLAPHGGSLSMIAGLQVVQTAALVSLPALNAIIVDDGVLARHDAVILRVGGLMIALTILQGTATVAVLRLSARTAMAVGRDLREQLYRHVLRLSVQQVAQLSVSSLVTRATNDVQQVQTLVLSLATVVVAAPLMAVGGVIMALTQNVSLSLLMVALVPALVVAVAIPIRRMRPLSGVMQDRIDAVSRVLREQIVGARVIRAFVRQDMEERRFGQVNGELAEVATRFGRSGTMLLPLVVTTVNVFSVAAVGVAGPRVVHGQLSVGAVTAFLTYLVMIQTAMLSAAFVITGLPRAEAGAARIDEVLLTQPAVAAPPEPVAELPTPGLVQLRGVHFRYSGAEQDVLAGIDITAHPGTTTAVVGSTGSGKTTLLSVACRLFDVSAGSVHVGGIDVRRLDPALLGRTLALVPQRPYLFSGTIASNLRYGCPEATVDELWHALAVAQAADFVQRLDLGLFATVRQGGANLSGGQRQRLAIAQALVRRPEIYLFDDAFSALDYVTESALRSALRAETARATVVIVAQRISTVRDADRIVVLDEGAVAEAGTHAELLLRSPVYQEIVQSQLGTEAVA